MLAQVGLCLPSNLQVAGLNPVPSKHHFFKKASALKCEHMRAPRSAHVRNEDSPEGNLKIHYKAAVT